MLAAETKASRTRTAPREKAVAVAEDEEEERVEYPSSVIPIPSATRAMGSQSRTIT